MLRPKFNEAQVAYILRQYEESTAIGEVCRKAGISESDLLQLAQEAWRAAVVGDEAPQATRG